MAPPDPSDDLGQKVFGARAPVPFDANPDAAKARRARSVALGIGLALFVVVVFVVTLAKLGGHVFDRPL